MYRATNNPNVVERIADHLHIPLPANESEGWAYERWLAEGNTPLPAPVIDFRPAVIAEFKAEREVLLNRMMSIAGRKARNGESAFAAALDWMAEQIIPLDAHPLVAAATDADAMREAFKLAYREVAAQALAQAPDAETQLAWKLEIDKVFK